MTNRVSSKKKEKKAKRKNSVKKKRSKRKKKWYKETENSRESNPVYLYVQATPQPLHHSDTHDLKY